MLLLAVAIPMEGQSHAEEMNESQQEEGRITSEAAQHEIKELHPLEAFLKKGEYTFIPLPAFAYSHNESYWIGALMPILKEDAGGHVGTIIAPQYLYNRLVRQTVTGNYYRYPSDTAQYEITGSFSEKVARDIDFRYRDVGVGGGRYIIGGQVEWFKNPFARFFGFGNRAQEQRETNYTSRETIVNLTSGINLNPDFALLFTERYRDVRVENGVVESLPSTKQLFGRVSGIEGAQIIGHRFTLFYDTRDHRRTPVKGSYITISGEYNQNLKHDEANRWWRYTLDARTLIPHAGGRLIFVLHFLLDGVIGEKLETVPINQANGEQRGIPFYERPMLGGENTLRGFGQNRFISNTALLFNVEERILVKELEIFGYAIGLECAPFIDLGRVQRTNPGEKLNLKHWQVNPGIGVRLLARPYIVGRADFAYGRDGFNTFVGLDYPF
jgi:outer membrane protein assembly factor BamA